MVGMRAKIAGAIHDDLHARQIGLMPPRDALHEQGLDQCWAIADAVLPVIPDPALPPMPANWEAEMDLLTSALLGVKVSGRGLLGPGATKIAAIVIDAGFKSRCPARSPSDATCIGRAEYHEVHTDGHGTTWRDWAGRVRGVSAFDAGEKR